MNHNVKDIADAVLNSKHLVVFTGAGISTSVGLSDYRGPNGVWTRRDLGLKPLPMKMSWNDIKPSKAHFSLVKLQKLGLLKALISQNVDGLHMKSGINRELLVELHGNRDFMRCTNCDKRFPKVQLNWDDEVFGKGYLSSKVHDQQPKCPSCQGRVISSIVNFGDPLPNYETSRAMEHSKQADVFIVVGSSLVVNPAAGYPRIAKKNGAQLFIINQGETPLDQMADQLISGDCEKIVPDIVQHIISNYTKNDKIDLENS